MRDNLIVTSDRNYKIVEHLRKRFKERFNIDLTRELRLDILTQCRSGMSNLCCLLPRGAEVRRIKVQGKEFNIVYDVCLKQITTVLSPPDSPDFEQFCKNNPDLSREKIINSYLTPKERTERDLKIMKENIMKEIDKAYDLFVEEQKQKRIKEAKKLIKDWKAIIAIEEKKKREKDNHD